MTRRHPALAQLAAFLLGLVGGAGGLHYIIWLQRRAELERLRFLARPHRIRIARRS